MPAFNFEAIGTHWQIDAKKLPKAVQSRIAKFDKDYSRFRSDSLVTKIYNYPGKHKLPAGAKPMLNLYKTLYDLTNGAMTPMIGQLISDAGYDAKYSLVSKKLARPPTWDDFEAGTKPILLDFGAAGKGYLIDIVGEILKKDFVIDAGGDILHSGKSSLRVGLEHPEDVSKIIGVVDIKNQAICGSAGNRRKWGKWHHILNPHTLSPQNKVLATWVIAKTAMVGDALSTALYFIEPEKLKPRFDFEYLILYPDYTVVRSEKFHEIY